MNDSVKSIADKVTELLNMIKKVGESTVGMKHNTKRTSENIESASAEQAPRISDNCNLNNAQINHNI